MFKHIISVLFILSCLITGAFAFSNTNEMDTLRASLACQRNKKSQEYLKTKAKLDKLIRDSHLDRSANARMADVQRMINEQKYNSAIYELEDMIAGNVNTSKSSEMLAYLYLNVKKDPYKSAEYLRIAVEADETNESATFALAKLYLERNKNILGTEYLRKTIDISKSNQYYGEIENIILKGVSPEDKYEANNLYETLGALYLKSGRNFDAYMAYRKAISLNPSDIALKYYLSNLLYLDNQTDSLISLYTNILKNNPNDNQIRANRAKMFLKKGNVTSAEEEYVKILSVNPKSNQARYGIYQIYKNTLPPEKLLQKFNLGSSLYLPDTEEIESFIEFLNSVGDYEAVNTFKNYLNERKIKKQQINMMEQERKLVLLKDEELRIKREEKERQERLEKERLEKERIEKERHAKLEQERLAKLEQERQVKLEQERIAKIEQERTAKLKEEQAKKERIAKAEQERIEKERLAKLEQERLEKERLAKLEQERLAKIEQERQAKIEQERLAKLEQERLEKERLAKLEQERIEKERIAKAEQEKIKKEATEKKEKATLIKEEAQTTETDKQEYKVNNISENSKKKEKCQKQLNRLRQLEEDAQANNDKKTNPKETLSAKTMQIEKERIEKLSDTEENNDKLELKDKTENDYSFEKELEAKRLAEKKLTEKKAKQKNAITSEAQKELKNAQNNKVSKYNDYKKTIEEYLNITPPTYQSYLAVANTYRQAGMPYNALKYFEEAKKIEPVNSDIYYNIGLVYMEMNELDEAKENIEKAISLNKDNTKAETLLNFVNQKITTSTINDAYSSFEKNKFVDAYLTLDKGIKKIPNNSQLYYYRGLATEAMNRNGSAITDFQKALELDPGNYMAYYYLGKCYEKINDEKSALVAFERFLSTEPNEKELTKEVQQKVIDLERKYY